MLIGTRLWCISIAVLVAWAALLLPGPMRAEPVAVRHAEGLVHGFLVLRTLEGETIADGDLIQVARRDRVTSRLVFHFKDGSLHDETAVFSHRCNFRLVSDRLIQKGPAFQHSMEVSIDGSSGQVTVRTTGDDGKKKVVTERLELPSDVSNSLVLTLLKNIGSDAPRPKCRWSRPPQNRASCGSQSLSKAKSRSRLVVPVGRLRTTS